MKACFQCQGKLGLAIRDAIYGTAAGGGLTSTSARLGAKIVTSWSNPKGMLNLKSSVFLLAAVPNFDFCGREDFVALHVAMTNM